MFNVLNDSVQTMVDRIVVLANHDPEFRSALAEMLHFFSGTDHHEASAVQGEQALLPVEPEEEIQPEPDGDAVAVAVEPTGPLDQETLSEAISTTVSRPPRDVSAPDLELIESRCRLKAKAARWAAERQRKLHEGIPASVAIAPFDRELIERAKALSDCYLWTNGPASPQPADLRLFEVLGGCFDVAADAALLLRKHAGELEDEEELFKQCLDGAAEAQSALRSAVMAVGGDTDADQQLLFDWLRNTTADKHIFIERYLRADDLADPYSWPEIQGRIQTVREACETAIARRQRRAQTLNRLRYHAGHVAASRGTEHDWDRIANAAKELLDDGVPPSNREVRDAILSIMGSSAEFVGKNRAG